jgi:hypothetical protein
MGESVACWIHNGMAWSLPTDKTSTPATAYSNEVLAKVRKQIETIASLVDCPLVKTGCANALSLLGDTP